MEWGPVDPLRLVIEDAGIDTLQDFMAIDYEETALMKYSVYSEPDTTTGERAETLVALTKPETNLLRISIAFAIARATNPVDGSEPGKYNWYECDGDDFEAFRTGNSGYTATKTFTEWRDSCRAEYTRVKSDVEKTLREDERDRRPRPLPPRDLAAEFAKGIKRNTSDYNERAEDLCSF